MKNWIFVLLIFSFLTSHSQTISEIEEVTPHGDYGYSFRNLSSGEVVAEHNGSRLFSPASVLKSVTTLIALEKLGPEFKYITEWGYRGQISNASLDGDLILNPKGDPTLGSRFIEDGLGYQEFLDLLVHKVLESGITEVNGDLIVNDFYFSGHEQSPDWNYKDLGNYYAAGIWSLNFHDNLFYADFNLGSKVGLNTKMTKTIPNVGNYIEIENEITTGGSKSGDQAYFFGDAYSKDYVARGTLPISKKPYRIRGSIPNVPQFFLDELSLCLEEKGVQMNGESIWNRSDDEVIIENILYRHESPTLAEIATLCNEKSINLYAEAIIRSLGESDIYSGTGSLGRGIEAELLYLKSNEIGIDYWHISDGSGLSHLNKIDAEGLTRLFRYASVNHSSFDAFHESLAEAGKEGTIKSLITGMPDLEGKIYAKSGTIEGNISLAGFIKSKTGEEYAFAIFIEQFEGKYNNTRRQIAKLLHQFYLGH